MTAAGMSYTAIAQWYGSNRMLAEHVGKALEGCEWIGVPFAGSMCELVYMKARTIVANDLHRHVINLARVAQHPTLGRALNSTLRLVAFHPEQLRLAQERCIAREGTRGFELGFGERDAPKPDLDWAVDYFIANWMVRNGAGGTKGELKAGLSVRYNSGGGDSVVRFRNAAKSLAGWEKILQRVTFVNTDGFKFIDECEDAFGHGIYCDPPFPGPGDRYKYRFEEIDHRRLARKLWTFKRTRVVCRFYDAPLIRELYPPGFWTWQHFEGRKVTNDSAPEVLISNVSDQTCISEEAAAEGRIEADELLHKVRTGKALI